MALQVIILVLAIIGHCVLWVTLINRSHGFGIPRKWVHVTTLSCLVAFAVLPIAVCAPFAIKPGQNSPGNQIAAIMASSYIFMCVAICIGSMLQRAYWAFHSERTGTLLSNHTAHVRLPDQGETLARGKLAVFLANLPGNEVFNIRTQEKELALPRLASAHDGLRIAHVTDLHMSGRIARPYYEHVVDEVNAATPDIIAVTGDLVEGDQFLDWIPPTLGRLRARYGVYYVLGNHDRRATEGLLKKALADAGLIHVSGICHPLTINGAPLVLVGNELPWYKAVSDLRECPASDSTARPARILLSHSPDQFRWAQENDIDLMMAGHLHGGQVRLPILGAFMSPSLFGVRYVAGIFAAGNTIMHVSRGLGALTPVRYNCPPEIAILVLRQKK